MNLKNLLTKDQKNETNSPLDFFVQLGQRSRNATRQAIIASAIREKNDKPKKAFRADDPAHSVLMKHLSDYLEEKE